MPKGKKKGKKGGKKSGKKGKKEGNDLPTTDAVPAVSENDEDDIFEDKEQQLKDKLFKINQDIKLVQEETEEMKRNIKTTEEECERVTEESEAFTNFLQTMQGFKKQNLVTLQDFYRDKIDSYNMERDNVMNFFEYQRSEILEMTEKKNSQIKKLQDEVQEYDVYIKQKEQQDAEIQQLEQEIQELRSKQAAELDQVKSELLSDYQRFQQESNEKVNGIAQAAFKEALQSLSTTCTSIRDENRDLRREMLWTIKQNQILKDKKNKTVEQNRIFKQEYQFAQDFATLRRIRQDKPMQLNQMMKEEKDK